MFYVTTSASELWRLNIFYGREVCRRFGTLILVWNRSESTVERFDISF